MISGATIPTERAPFFMNRIAFRGPSSSDSIRRALLIFSVEGPQLLAKLCATEGNEIFLDRNNFADDHPSMTR